MSHVEHHKWNAELAEGVQLIPGELVRWLYVSSYYDGPLDGRVIVKGPKGPVDSSVEILWAQVFEECNETEENLNEDLDLDYIQVCGFYRKYLLYRLSNESDAEEQRRHKLFEQHVGTHWSYSYDEFGNSQRDHSGLKPQSEWHKFYDAQKTWPKWKPEGEVIGWFQI